MAHTYDIPIELVSTHRIDAMVRGHLVRTDQPIMHGGKNEAPSPFDLFLASIGTCAGLSVQTFCVKRDLPFEDIRITERVALDDHGILTGVDVAISLPASFPKRYIAALENIVTQCAVARSVLARPRFSVSAREAAEHVEERAVAPHG